MGKKMLRLASLFVFVIAIFAIASCGSTRSENPGELADTSGEAPPLQSGQVRQWAISAEAQSEFAAPEWAASQAVGAPDTLRCGDYQTAWATAGSDATAWLDLQYQTAVYVTAVNIVQTFNPNQVVKVELVGAFDRAVTVFEGEPSQVDQPCPYTFSVPVDKTEGRFSRVRITVDQSVLGLGWNQIDAVELVGDTTAP